MGRRGEFRERLKALLRLRHSVPAANGCRNESDRLFMFMMPNGLLLLYSNLLVMDLGKNLTLFAPRQISIDHKVQFCKNILFFFFATTV